MWPTLVALPADLNDKLLDALRSVVGMLNLRHQNMGNRETSTRLDRWFGQGLAEYMQRGNKAVNIRKLTFKKSRCTN